ncbi:hypothetical protein D5086_023087, partial [Populus alba]
NKQKQHPWPEWVTFVDKLKTRGYFMETSEDENIIAYTDMNQLRDGCLSFARDRYDVLKSLSIPDIQTVVESGCPNILRKVVNSAKRMRAYVQKDEEDACSACIHRGCCDRAFVILKSKEAEGRTIDIVRVLMFHALDPLVISEGEKSPGSELIEASARKLLSELVELSETPHDPALPKHTPKTPDKKERVVNFTGGKLRENVEMKKGDWICTKCEFLNFSRNIKCLKCKADGPERVAVDNVEMKRGDWNCTKCDFMNFSRNAVCLKCDCKRPREAITEVSCFLQNSMSFGRGSSSKRKDLAVAAALDCLTWEINHVGPVGWGILAAAWHLATQAEETPIKSSRNGI